MNQIATIEQNTQVSEINAFEITIQEHEKELDFIPDMESTDSRKLSSDALRQARKTWKAVDDIRLEKKKEAEQLANAIHKQGKDATNRLEAAYNPHKLALDSYKAEQKEIEEAVKQAFYDACQWLSDVNGACQFASTEEITAFIAEVEAKDQDNTGLDLSKDQKFAYAKSRMEVIPKLNKSLELRIIKDAEEESQKQAALELAQQQETLRKQQEEFEAQQQEQARLNAAREAKEQAEEQAKINAEEADKAAKLKLEAAEQATKQAVIDKENAEKQAIVDAENNRAAEERRLKAAQEKAAEDERLRIQAEQVQAQADELARKKNRAHKGKILGEAKVTLMAEGIEEEVAVKVLKLIAAGKVSHTAIKF